MMIHSLSLYDIIFKSNHEDGLGIIVAAKTEDTLQTDMLAGFLIILATD
jgi:hypothetical protein